MAEHDSPQFLGGCPVPSSASGSTAVNAPGGIFTEAQIMIAAGFRMVRAGGMRLVGLILFTQLAIAAVAFPLLGWIFREALRAGGMHGLDLAALGVGGSGNITITLLLIVVIITVAFWLISLQFTALVIVLRWPRLSARGYLAQLRRVAAQLAHPRSLSLLGYLFLLVPLSGFGFTSAIAQGIALPGFVSGELLKASSTTAILAGYLLFLLWLNLRLSLTVPVFVLTGGRRSARTSWRLTRGVRAPLAVAIAVAAVLVIAGLASAALFVTAIVPTAITDALAPGASPTVAAFCLGAAQIVGVILAGLATAWIAGALITRVDRDVAKLPAGVSIVPDPPAVPAKPGDAYTSAMVPAVAVVVAAVLGVASIAPLEQLAQAPSSAILGHRGFSDGGVENTLGSLEAAARAGADLVEMDVMQTKDGEFVAMHDVTLGRLAGQDLAVKDLTLAELTQIEVHDRFGNVDPIPSFTDYVVRAAELGLPLLIEIKLSGAETPDHVELLVAELEALGLLETNIYHSLDRDSVATLKHTRPDLSVGYTMAFAGGGIPDTPADFIVVEEWTASESMQRAAEKAGLGFYAWTVNEEASLREHLRRGTDGIITDHTDLAVALRDEIGKETGLTDVLVDAFTRFVTVV